MDDNADVGRIEAELVRAIADWGRGDGTDGAAGISLVFALSGRDTNAPFAPAFGSCDNGMLGAYVVTGTALVAEVGLLL